MEASSVLGIEAEWMCTPPNVLHIMPLWSIPHQCRACLQLPLIGFVAGSRVLAPTSWLLSELR